MKNKLLNSAMCSLVFLAVACGGGGGGGGGSTPKKSMTKNPMPIEQAEEEVSQVAPGKFAAFIRPLNTRVYGFINSGKAEITLNDNFSVNLIMDDAPGVVHIQSIHTGTSCPRLSGDTNKDGYVDIVESEAFTGPVLIPLDDNLESQIRGTRTYPTGKSYTFKRQANLNKMMKDLKLPDDNSSDRVIKLNQAADLDLEGKIILIHGASVSANLPGTVQTRDGLTRAQSIPIACGKIEKVTDL